MIPARTTHSTRCPPRVFVEMSMPVVDIGHAAIDGSTVRRWRRALAELL